MKANSCPIRTGSDLIRFETLDGELRTWALAQAEEYQFPALIPSETLHRAGYPEAFPHLLMAASVAADPNQPLADGNFRLDGWSLSPAVCYHAYAALAGRNVGQGRTFTARGCCFRHEEADELAPGRRQIEFEMRELILVGPADWIEARLTVLRPEVEALASRQGLAGNWQPASDPFFLPRARGKAQMQRLLGAKIEYSRPCGLAIASINRHGVFFGERFDIRDSAGAPAHSACIAFGLDRWAAQAANNL